MKFLLMNGSPHKGNTWLLAELVKQSLSQADSNAEFEEIHLSALQIPFCTGCSNCFRRGFDTCPHHQKIAGVVDAIDKADGVIVTSTTFNMRETALLKNLFDHLCFMLHRPYFFKSKALILTTTGGIGGKAAAKSIASTLKGIGFNRCYMFSAAAFSWNLYKPKQRATHRLAKVTNTFYRDVASGKMHYPVTNLLIPYNLFRGMSLAYVPGSEYETEDGRYWTEPVRKDMVYDGAVPVFILQKPIGYLFYWIGKIAGNIKSMQVTYKK